MFIAYYPNLQPYIEEQRINGIRTCDVKIYNANGQLINTIEYDNLQICFIEYYQNNQRHNLHGPACMSWVDVQIHSIQYRQNDRLHNLHGPALIMWYDNGEIYFIEYRQNGFLHNLHGPAFIHWSNGKICIIEFYHFGKLIKN